MTGPTVSPTVGLDATPLVGRLTGVGTYVHRLVHALAALPTGEAPSLVATAFTVRGAGALPARLPDGVPVRSRPVPARLLRRAWGPAGAVPVELLTGPLDVFHATNFVLPPARRAAGVLTVHDLAYLRHRSTVAAASLAYRELVPLGIARAGAVCTPSAAVREQVLDAYRVDPDRVHVTPLGVDPVWHRAQPDPEVARRLDLPGEYLLAVGTLEPRKNLATLVAAHRLLSARREDVPPLVLVGGEGWGESLALTPEDRVRLTGHLDDADLRALVAGATLLAFPSLDEGFGLPPLEALACGVPVLASDLPVTREVLGDAAAYGDAGDVEAWADALERALRDPVGDPGTRRERAARFTWEATARATLRAYEVALGRAPGSP
ncbi:glycosyltransferase family 4 protein [Lapillicoccus jejuensis]|uniref:Glycosyltransferase involved in cell wall biosynthesis n=1 Tax=Lapillicoccus jejuensis TaxID=402171 RepID=A0A542DVY2_9MICO|nr:glycosyltransferase family 1 protein [Lapillicoccus jejuensis]TQJ07258.1 glycosyltransferase involved in cell wall biosynthesis [Lapillicoccus jejuensis]